MDHPGQGQTSREIRHDGKHTRKNDIPGFDGQATGGSGLRDEECDKARRLARETTEHRPRSAREHNTTLEGVEDKVPASSEVVAAERE